ncbi:MAG: UDP-N-acetylglucosamine--N-acetylmuramyl-(pentapeptide) pyrophosphoryl-undecaprenol N-acetylglucosamine transferase [Bulleidia sp.]
MKVMIAAGGTGGHIYPALALADMMMRDDASNEIVFFGSNDRLESSIIPSRGYRFIGTDMISTQGGIVNKIGSLVSLIRAEMFSKKMLKEEKPDICIGFGNYISVPLIRAAHALHIPVLLHEQNSYPGKANVYLSGIADRIVTCYPSDDSMFPQNKTVLLGNPQASLAKDVVFDPKVIEDLGLNPAIPYVIVMMGSLGSASVSRVLDEACPLFDTDYQVIIASGKSNGYTFGFRGSDTIRIVEYVDGKVMLKGCALAVLRAGATTMAEIAAVGCPSILIPSPYVPNNHQYYNAKQLSDAGAAVLLEEKDLSAQSLAQLVNALMKDENRRESMRIEAEKQGKSDAAEKMIALCKELIQ